MLREFEIFKEGQSLGYTTGNTPEQAIENKQDEIILPLQLRARGKVPARVFVAGIKTFKSKKFEAVEI